MMGASLVVNHAGRRGPDVRFALATGKELKRPEASWVFVVWLEGWKP